MATASGLPPPSVEPAASVRPENSPAAVSHSPAATQSVMAIDVTVSGISPSVIASPKARTTPRRDRGGGAGRGASRGLGDRFAEDILVADRAHAARDREDGEQADDHTTRQVAFERECSDGHAGDAETLDGTAPWPMPTCAAGANGSSRR